MKTTKMKKIDPVIKAVVDLKTLLMKNIVDRPATYHACDVLSKIAGWELASIKDPKVDLPKKVHQIYQEQADISRGY